VHRFNADGIKGLSNKAGTGRPLALSEEQISELKAIVLAGPDLAKNGVVRWRCCDLQDVIVKRFGVRVHKRTVGKLLRRLRLTRLQPRPHNPKRDEAAQALFKNDFAALVAAALQAQAAGKALEIWFEDEARVGQQGSYGAVWNEVGSRAAVGCDDRHDSAWVLGSVCPQRPVGSALVTPWVGSEVIACTSVRSARSSVLARMPCWSATVRAGIRPAGGLSCPTTLPCYYCQAIRRNPTRLKTSGPTCGETS